MASKPKKVAKTLMPVVPWAEAMAHLRGLDAKWAARIERVGPCRLEAKPDRFATIVRAIVGQQISTKAATAIDRRLRSVAGDPPLPQQLLALDIDTLRAVGLSRTKAQYILNLAGAVHSGEIPIADLHTWDDQKIVQALTSIKGIGPWTAEMFLIFALNRPDVLSAGDLGIRVGLKNHHGLDELPTPKQCRELTEALRPYRSVAMWYLWEDLDGPKDRSDSSEW